MRLIQTAAGGWTAAWATILVVRGLLPAGIVYVTKWLVDSVADAVGGGLDAENVMMVALPASVMALLLLLQQGLQSLVQWVQTAQSELLQDHIKSLIHEKAVSVDYGFYESPEYFDLLQEANSQAASKTLSLLQNIGTIAQNAITFISIAAILITYSLWLPVILLLGTVPAVYVVVRHNRRYHAWWQKTTKDRRWAQYLDVLFMEPRFAAEMRLYELGSHFREQYQETRERLREERLDLMRRQALATLGAAGLALAVTGGIMIWIVLRALRGAARLGDIALFYQAINQGQNIVRSLLSSVGKIYTDTLFLEHLFTFLSIEPTLEEPATPQRVPEQVGHGITFEEVTFTYPGSNEPAVSGLNLHLPAGQLTAIVGSNGAGKSTLIKLLCRFYDPSEGRILIDGKDIRNFSQVELRRRIAIMFQFPVHFQATAHENILLGDRDAGDEDVLRAAEGARARSFIERLPRQFQTILGRLFPEGTELSGGEWQRVALARAYLRQAPIVVLDEPTSSMDSWTEHEWLERFRHLVAGRTALIITHRFTTARQADVIHVMEEGGIVESGSHEELVAQGGLYATSWRAQTERQRRDLVPDDEELTGGAAQGVVS